MNWGQSESKQKHCSLSLFIAPSLSLLLFAQTNERAGEEGGGSLECRDRKCVLAERAVRASCRRSTLRHAIKHTHSTDMDHLDELSFLQHAGPGMLFSQRRVKEQLQILSFSSFLSSLALFFFNISAHHFAQLLCYSHTNSVIIQTLNKLYNHSCPLPNRGCAGLSEINLHILNISY